MYYITEANGEFYSTDLEVEFVDELSEEQTEIIDELLSQGKPVVLVNNLDDFKFTFATKVKSLNEE